MQVNRQNLKWFGRMLAILLLVCGADALVAMFVRRPLPWIAVISFLLPLLLTVFVMTPMIRAEKS